MGIRFLCPNGHKLNVKAFLAGKRGVCPDCGTRFTIPLESTTESVAASDAGESTGASDPQGALSAASGPSSQPMPPAPPGGTPDPIDEAPEAVWYVRPKAGGQFGPAAGETMRQWLHEGRVAADSLVWRDGWPDWKDAGDVFAALGANGSAAPAAVSDPFEIRTDDDAEELQETPLPAPTTPARRRRGGSKSIAFWLLGVVILLAIATVVLITSSS